ncbi:hypothetical protein ACLEPN_19340 [Myxococcus sp. 1LA]
MSDTDSESTPKRPRQPKLRNPMGPARYRKVATSLWREPRFLALSPPAPSAQHLVLYLMTNPSTGSVPGLYAIRESTIAEELGWTLEGFREAFQEAFEKGFVKADWKAGLLWLPDVIHQEPPANPNVVKGWARAVRELPKCPLLLEALDALRDGIHETFAAPQAFLKAFREAFPEPFLEALGKGLPKGYPKQETGDKRQETGSRMQEGDARASAREAPAPAASASEPEAPAPASPPPPEPAPAHHADGTLPFERPLDAGPPAESLRDGVERVFLAAKGKPYRWQRGDDDACRKLMALAGDGGVREVLERWGHGVTAVFRQRCDSLSALVSAGTTTPRPRSARRAARPPAPPPPRSTTTTLSPGEAMSCEADTTAEAPMHSSLRERVRRLAYGARKQNRELELQGRALVLCPPDCPAPTAASSMPTPGGTCTGWLPPPSTRQPSRVPSAKQSSVAAWTSSPTCGAWAWAPSTSGRCRHWTRRAPRCGPSGCGWRSPGPCCRRTRTSPQGLGPCPSPGWC